MIERISFGMMDAAGISISDEKGPKQDVLKIITKPTSSRLLQVDKNLATKTADEADPTKRASWNSSHPSSRDSPQ